MKKDVIVFKREGTFAAWPAGFYGYSWGDEIIVGYQVAVHKDGKGHTFDRDLGWTVYQSRSLDGGLTWEEPVDTSHVAPAPAHQLRKPELIKEFEGKLDFTDPDLCLSFNMSGTKNDDFSWWSFSTDRGYNWNGPYSFPKMEGFDVPLNMRTQYIVESKDEILVFGSCQRSNGTEGRVFCARMYDGGRKMEFLSYVGDELPTTDECYEIMPQARRRKDGTLVCINRRFDSRNRVHYFTLAQYLSKDNGRTWEFDQHAVEHYGGNPGALSIMNDGTWSLVYGYRKVPFGIRCKYSEDEGRTWSDEIVLRDDGGCGDLGYPRASVRSDGSVVVCYYFNEGRETMRHIQASIFDKDFLLGK